MIIKLFVSSLFVLFLWTGDAFSQEEYRLGMNFLSKKAYQALPKSELSSHAAVRSKSKSTARVDLSRDFPQPGNQGSQSSCVGWAVAYAVKSYQEKKERDWQLGKRDTTFSPAFLYNQIAAGRGCPGNGSLLTDAFDVLIHQGVATLKKFPYNEKRCSPPPSSIKKQASPYRIHSFRRLGTQDVVWDIKHHLNIEVPVIIGMLITDTFMKLKAGDIFDEGQARRGKVVGGHAMTIVGYDDRKQAFKLMNSWGTGWGDGGFGWVSYGVLKTAIQRGDTFEAYVMIDEISGDSPVEWNWINKPGYSKETEWIDKTGEGRAYDTGARPGRSGAGTESRDSGFRSGKPELW